MSSSTPGSRWTRPASLKNAKEWTSSRRASTSKTFKTSSSSSKRLRLTWKVIIAHRSKHRTKGSSSSIKGMLLKTSSGNKDRHLVGTKGPSSNRQVKIRKVDSQTLLAKKGRTGLRVEKDSKRWIYSRIKSTTQSSLWLIRIRRVRTSMNNLQEYWIDAKE